MQIKVMNSVAKRIGIIAVGGMIAVAGFAGVALSDTPGTSGLSLSGVAGPYHTGDQFTVNVNFNATNNLSGIGAYVDFDSSQLQYVSLTENTNDFDLAAPTTVTSFSSGGVNYGEVKIPVAKSTSFTSTTVNPPTVGTITFRVIGSSGSTNLTFDPSSFIGTTANPSANDWNGVTTGATVNIASSSSSSGSTTGSGSSSSKSSGKKAAASAPAPAAPAATPSPTPVASTTPATGYLVAIKVTDSSGKTVTGAKVTLGNDTQTTLGNGIASFTNVPSGSHTVTVEIGTSKITQTISVDGDNAHLAIQQFGVKVAGSSQQNYFWIIAVILVLLAIGGGGLTLGQTLTRNHRLALAHPHSDVAQTATHQPADEPAAATTNNDSPMSQIFYPQSPGASAPNAESSEDNSGA